VDDINPRSYFLRGMVWLKVGDTIHAIKNFQQALVVDDDFYEANAELGLLYAGKKNDLAIDFYQSAIRLDPDNASVYYSLGYFYQETERYQEAIKTYDLLLKKFPKYALAYYNKGYIYLLAYEDYDKAIRFFSKAIEYKPSYANAYYNRGYAQLLKGNVKEAGLDFEKCLEVKPDHEMAKKRLAELKN